MGDSQFTFIKSDALAAGRDVLHLHAGLNPFSTEFTVIFGRSRLIAGQLHLAL
jgi:hypothetical protein